MDALHDNNNNNLDVCSAIIYGKAITRVHSDHFNECGPAPAGRRVVVYSFSHEHFIFRNLYFQCVHVSIFINTSLCVMLLIHWL